MSTYWVAPFLISPKTPCFAEAELGKLTPEYAYTRILLISVESCQAMCIILIAIAIAVTRGRFG